MSEKTVKIPMSVVEELGNALVAYHQAIGIMGMLVNTSMPELKDLRRHAEKVLALVHVSDAQPHRVAKHLARLAASSVVPPKMMREAGRR